MKRNFRHPHRMYHRREDGPWFTGRDVPHENGWTNRPFPRWNEDCREPGWVQGSPDPQWGHPNQQQDRHNQWRGKDPQNSHWGHRNPQWDHHNQWRGEDPQNSQCFPAPQRDQYHPEQPSRDYGCGFDNGNFRPRGSGSYRRFPRSRFRGKYEKCSSSFYKGKDSSHDSSRVLVEVQQSKKENDSKVKKDESGIPKETKQAEENSVASVENTKPPQVSQEASKAIISPSEFSFRLPSDSATCLLCRPAKTEDTEMIKLGAGSKTEDSHQVECCTQEATSELPATLENLELKKEDEEIELDKLEGTQATEAQPSQAASLPYAKVPMEEAPSNTAESPHPVIHEEPMLATEAHCSLVASAEAPTGKQAPSETVKDSRPVEKEAQVPETKQDMNIASSTDSSSVTELSVPPCVVEPQAPLETSEALLSLGREEDELLESSQPTDHFNLTDSPPPVEIPFLFDTTDECQYNGKKDLELSQMEGSHEDKDYRWASDALAGGSSALPFIPSDVHSVPVLVRGKVPEQPYFWESESSLPAQNFNWSDGGKGWAPEDYQEPSWGVDKANNCGDISEPERNLVLSHSSFHSRHSSDQNPNTGIVLECCSSSSKSHHDSDSKHSSTQRTIKRSRSPLRQDHHSRSPLRQRRRSRSPVKRDRSRSWDSNGSIGGKEITRTDYRSKCCCKCCHNPPQQKFQRRELPESYSTHKMRRYHPSKENSKSHRASRSSSPKSSTTKRKKKSTHHEETKKGKSTSVKKRKSSKITTNGGKALVPINQKAALAVETSIPAETTKHFQSTSTEGHESVQLAPSSEDTSFPCQPCAGKENGTSAPSKIVEDPRSVAVLTRRNQIEQDYLQVVLNLAVVATMLLQKEPCMEQALEAALRANMRSIGDHYESMLKNFIDDYDFSETH